MFERYCEFCTIYDGELQSCDNKMRCPRDPSHITSSLEGIVKEVSYRREHAARKVEGWNVTINHYDRLLQKIKRTKTKPDGKSQWPTPCVDEFSQMLRQQPALLLQWIQSEELSPANITYAAAIAGDMSPAEGAVAVLFSLLQHKNAVVREGAALGLSRQLHAITEKLKAMTQTDPSDGVRATIKDILDS